MESLFCSEVRATLLPLADPARALAMQAYMRNRFVFFGIQTPARRQALAPLLRVPQSAGELLATASELWDHAERECQYTAVDLLARQQAQLGLAEVEALLALVQRKSWWDSVDGLAGIVGKIVRRERRDGPAAQAAMDAALGHENLWVRRVALLHQLGWRDETDRQRLFAYALAQAGEADFFIRKAIGWALRDFARHDPAAVADFLAGAGSVLSPLSRREAAKHLAKPLAT
ncbi:DNA alkylation repair protein [Rhodocyclus tenuis]|uniref:DNA alkylation repair protein n=1 Tax=Rhodocyclus tenuis TaxID=1066 RepID=UPI001904D0FB|nr:DNA alkylation repair protein [Rhodocyclus tenuis]MBK1681283.1 DNA alkylation repair protein [Rhodocyclus tenuis]